MKALLVFLVVIGIPILLLMLRRRNQPGGDLDPQAERDSGRGGSYDDGGGR